MRIIKPATRRLTPADAAAEKTRIPRSAVLLVITGPIDDVNDVLATLVYQGTANFNGPDTLIASATEPAIPSLDWSTYMGGTTTDFGHSTAVDTNGNIYITGETRGDWSGEFNTLNNYNGGFNDAFVSKFDQSGNHLWTRYLAAC